MNYVIMSGKFETGNEEQQAGFAMLLGSENIRYKFDLYFHWYNLVHEMGHCIVERYGAKMTPLQEEMFVNRFAVGYYRLIGEDARLDELRQILQASVDAMPSPVPEGEGFEAFYERIWGTEQLMNVMVYGYLQLNSVLMALKSESTLDAALQELGLSLSLSSSGSLGSDASLSSDTLRSDDSLSSSPKALARCDLPVSSENAEAFLNTARENLLRLGIDVPEIRLELQDDPLIQCAREA